MKESSVAGDEVNRVETAVFPARNLHRALVWIGSCFSLLAPVLQCFFDCPCDLWFGLPFRHTESLNSKPGSWQAAAWSDLRGHCIGMH